MGGTKKIYHVKVVVVDRAQDSYEEEQRLEDIFV